MVWSRRRDCLSRQRILGVKTCPRDVNSVGSRSLVFLAEDRKDTIDLDEKKCYTLKGNLDS